VSSEITWSRGGSASIVSIASDAVVLRSTVPSPPGSRIEGAALGEAVRFKVHSSKKQDDGSFVIEGRPIDLSKALREKLEAIAESAVSRS
jgi:hypothetical protein